MSKIEKFMVFVAIPLSIFVIVAGAVLLTSMADDNPTVVTPAVVNAPNAGVDLPLAQDLKGEWIAQENDIRFRATVTDTNITIHMENNDTSFVYWVGTFDFTMTGTLTSNKIEVPEMVMSQADSKVFVTDRDSIQFDFTAMGMTKKVNLSRA